MAKKRKGTYLTVSVDDAVLKLQQLQGRMQAEAEKEIVLAGAESAETVWKQKITEAGHVTQGGKNTAHMVEAVGHTEPTEGANGMHCYVYPLDEDDRGTRQALKAFVINSSPKATTGGIYAGHNTKDTRFKGTRGDKFITGAGGINELQKQPVVDAMQAKLNEIVNKETGE